MYPEQKEIIVGGGMLGAMQAYFAYLDSKQNNKQVRVTVYEKNHELSQTTVANGVPSLTKNEMLAVVPRVNVLVEKLGMMFNQPGGIRVDIPGVNDSEISKQFVKQVLASGADEQVNKQRADALLEMGKISMDMWQKLYEQGDPEFRSILEASNFKPCHEPKQVQRMLNDGYRIDLLNIPGAAKQAEDMKNEFTALGDQHCKLLSPDEVQSLDPFLTDFCNTNSELQDGVRVWKNEVAALYRPGGCLDTSIFLPNLFAYLEKKMGTYVNATGVTKNCFRIKFDRLVNGVEYDQSVAQSKIIGLHINGELKQSKHKYADTTYVFCPGENVGTLAKLGFLEPAYTGFAGVSLRLFIPVPPENRADYAKLNHWMEVYRPGVVQTWQTKFTNDQIYIGLAGTKAFYGDVKPGLSDDFAKDRNLLQLNMINYVLPELIALAFAGLGKETRGVDLTEQDLKYLEDIGIAKRWVGVRAVAADGFATFGNVYPQVPKDFDIHVEDVRHTKRDTR